MGHISVNDLPKMTTVTAIVAASKLPRSNVYRLLKNGDLKSVKIGRRRLIPVEAVIELLTPKG